MINEINSFMTEEQLVNAIDNIYAIFNIKQRHQKRHLHCG